MATHLRPHTASHSPKRPVSSYSMSSTIRRVTPSLESLSEALTAGYATQSTPPRPVQSHSLHNLGRASVDDKTLLSVEGAPNPEYQSDASRARSLNSHEHRPNYNRRSSRIPVPKKHTSGGSSKVGDLKRRKAGRVSPSKLGAPRQHRPILSSSPVPSFQASENLTISAASGSQAASAGLAMPKSPSQPPPAVPADERGRLGEFTLFPTEDPFAPQTPTSHQTIDPTRPAVRHEEDYFQDRPFYDHEPDEVTPLPTSPRKPLPSPWKKPAQEIVSDVPSPLRPQNATATAVKPQFSRQASTRSVASNVTFSTPGRDEMERKRGHADEGPFGTATGVQELVERRRQISEGKSVSQRFEQVGKKGKQEKKESGGLCKCVVM